MQFTHIPILTMRIPPWYWFRHEKTRGADQALRVPPPTLGQTRTITTWATPGCSSCGPGGGQSQTRTTRPGHDPGVDRRGVGQREAVGAAQDAGDLLTMAKPESTEGMTLQQQNG